MNHIDPLVGLAQDYVRVAGIEPNSFEYSVLTTFSRWVRIKTASGSPLDLRRSDTKDWITYASNLGWDDNQLQQVKRTLMSWWTWLRGHGVSPPPITISDLNQIRVWHDHMVPDARDVERLFATHRDLMGVLRRFDWHRQDLILRLLYDLALEPEGLAEISLRDLTVKTQTLRYPRSGITIRLPGPVNTSLSRWLKVRATHAPKQETALLVTSHGHPITKFTVLAMIRKLSDYADVDVTAHQLRTASLVYASLIGERNPVGMLTQEKPQITKLVSRLNQDEKTFILKTTLDVMSSTDGTELTYNKNADQISARALFRLKEQR